MAISINNETVSFSHDQCSGCMLCVEVCPNDAFIYDINYLALLHSVINKQHLVLSCEKISPHTDHVFIPCVGIISEPLFASLSCLTEGTLFFDVSRCSDCKNSNSFNHFQSIAQSILKKIGKPDSLKIKFITEKPSNSVEEKNTERRSLFKAINHSVKNCGQSLTENKSNLHNKSFSPSHKGPTNNSKALQFAIEKLSAPKKKFLFSYHMSIRVDDNCDCCPSCAGMCPTGALKRKRAGEGEKTLIFLSSSCSGCGLCKEYCKKNALMLKKGFKGDPTVPLTIKSFL